ncbi:unnamed protein product [Closterium sp. NIES-54]
MGGSRMDHGRTSDVHDHANAALSNPILLWRGRKREGLADAPCTTEGSETGRGKLPASVRVQTQNRKVGAETRSELETGCVDPVDQHLSDVTLAAQGEHRGVTRVVVNHQQKVTLSRKKEREAPESRVKVWRTWADVVPEGADSPVPEAADTLAPRAATSPPGSGGRHSGARELVTPRVCQAAETALSGVQAPTSLTTSVPLTKLLGGRGLTTALLLLALTTTGTTPLRRAATSATAASATSTTASATTAATDASTPATTPTTTPAPSTASTTTTSTTAASPTGTPAPLAPAWAASPARGRRSADRLETTEVGRSSRGNRG